MITLNHLFRIITNILFLMILIDATYVNAEEPYSYRLDTGSFVYHAYAPEKKFNQYFKNDLFAIDKPLENSTYSVISGTLINSEANRCVLLGMGKSYWTYKSWDFEGRYMYAGEFFLKAFSHCGDAGSYHDFKRLTGIGFTPYIFHGIKYRFTKNFSTEAGVILPGIVVLNLNLSF